MHVPPVRSRTARSAAARLLMAILSGCAGSTPPEDPQLVAQWLRSSLAFVRSERLGPPVAARISAYAAVTLYEGYSAGTGSTLRSLRGQLNGLDAAGSAMPAGALDGATVAAEAERVVLDSLFRDGFASTRRTIDSLAAAQVTARAAAGVNGAARERSRAAGQAIGASILAWAATDGFLATRGKAWVPPATRDHWANTATLAQYVPQTLSGESDFVSTTNPGVALEMERVSEKWVFTNRPKAAGPTTLPAFNPLRPTEPYWGTLRTFVIRDGDECAPPPPPAYSERPGSPFWTMGREFHDSVRVLTPAQRQSALFWADNPVATGTPGFHWISVVNQMIARRRLTAERAVELYALTSLAMADAFIGCWKEKYRSLVVRPVVYEQRVFDPAYTTVFSTPPFPEYPSGHSVISAAAVDVLIAVLGDSIAFVDSTQVDIGHPPRAFASFTAARDEVAASRVYGGVHYWPAVREGLAQGRCIGTRVLARVKTRKPT